MLWLNKAIKIYQNFRPFTDLEAWNLFKIGAISEAVGWSLLISGILISKYVTPGNSIAVQLAGHTHGILFLIYITAVILCAPSQNWSFKRTVIAGLASVPPYGSLIFEQWVAHKRRSLNMDKRVSLAIYKKLLDLDGTS